MKVQIKSFFSKIGCQLEYLVLWMLTGFRPGKQLFKRSTYVFNLSLLVIGFPVLLFGQGIRFEQNVSWQQIKAKAKSENKFIFVDCYATWCGPCKMMDRDVYPNDTVGSYVNEHFISYKIQMDTSKADLQEIKDRYADAHNLMINYRVREFPTFLFFSPEGKLVHKGIGYQSKKRFISLAQAAADPAKQFYTLREQFAQGNLPFPQMPYLADAASAFRASRFRDSVVQAYVADYLLKQPENTWFTTENMGMLVAAVGNNHNKAFSIIYAHQDKVDSIAKRKGFAQSVINPVIERDVWRDLFKDGDPKSGELAAKPDWENIHAEIQNKYSQKDADRVVLWVKLKWLEYKKDWPEYCRNVVEEVEQYGPYVKIYPYSNGLTVQNWNYTAWDIFMYAEDRALLNKALGWSKKVLNSKDIQKDLLYTACLDTYANLLYKLGRTKEALQYEQKTVSLDPKDTGMVENLQKMKKGQPTWVWPVKKTK